MVFECLDDRIVRCSRSRSLYCVVVVSRFNWQESSCHMDEEPGKIHPRLSCPLLMPAIAVIIIAVASSIMEVLGTVITLDHPPILISITLSQFSGSKFIICLKSGSVMPGSSPRKVGSGNIHWSDVKASHVMTTVPASGDETV